MKRSRGCEPSVQPRRAVRPALSRRGTPAGCITTGCSPSGAAGGVLTDGAASLRLPSAGDAGSFAGYAAGQDCGLGEAWLLDRPGFLEAFACRIRLPPRRKVRAATTILAAIPAVPPAAAQEAATPAALARSRSSLAVSEGAPAGWRSRNPGHHAPAPRLRRCREAGRSVTLLQWRLIALVSGRGTGPRAGSKGRSRTGRTRAAPAATDRTVSWRPSGRSRLAPSPGPRWTAPRP